MHLFLRADASTKIGSGHLMRCLALAQAWNDFGGSVSFITYCDNQNLIQQLRNQEFDVHNIPRSYPHEDDWKNTSAILASQPNSWIVIDGYNYDETYYQNIRNAGHHLLVIDDLAHLSYYPVDIVLNQNLHANQLHYASKPDTQLLLGASYAILRRQFRDWKNWQRDIPNVAHNVLVTLGGTDSENHTLNVISALNKLDNPELKSIIVVGAANPHIRELENATSQSSIKIDLIHNAQNMPDLMAWADIAICAAGTTLLEMLFMGVPLLTLVLAENQLLNAEEMDRLQIGRYLGKAKDVSADAIAESIGHLMFGSAERARMSEKARKTVDGLGVQKVVSTMQEIKIC